MKAKKLKQIFKELKTNQDPKVKKLADEGYKEVNDFMIKDHARKAKPKNNQVK